MENSKPTYWQNAERPNGRMAMMGLFALVVNYGLSAGSSQVFFKMNVDIFLISFFTYLLVPVVMIAKGKKATN